MTTFVDVSLGDLEQKIHSFVGSGRPASFIRFNDGEARVVGGSEFFHPDAVNQSLRKYFGDNLLSSKELTALEVGVIEAVKHADIVGVPPPDWPRDFSLARDVLRARIPRSEIQSTHVDFHQHLFASGFLRNLFNATPVNLVTCRKVTDFIRSVYGAFSGRVYVTPEQADGSLSAQISRHYPNYCNWLAELLRRESSGQVFLIGSGVCGKIYAESVRAGGGVAIDIGSIFDLWAGRFSRPYMTTDGIREYYSGKGADPNLSPEVARAVAEIHYQDRDVESALRVLRSSRTAYPTEMRLIVAEVMLLVSVGRTEEGASIAEDVAKYSSVDIALVMGRILKEAGMLPEADRLFLTAFYANPLWAPVLKELANAVISRPSCFSPDIRVRIELALEASSNDLDHATLFQFARLSGANGNYKKAIEICGRALSIYSLDPAYFQHQLAWLAKSGQTAQRDRLNEELELLLNRHKQLFCNTPSLSSGHF